MLASGVFVTRVADHTSTRNNTAFPISRLAIIYETAFSKLRTLAKTLVVCKLKNKEKLLS